MPLPSSVTPEGKTNERAVFTHTGLSTARDLFYFLLLAVKLHVRELVRLLALVSSRGYRGHFLYRLCARREKVVCVLRGEGVETKE